MVNPAAVDGVFVHVRRPDEGVSLWIVATHDPDAAVNAVRAKVLNDCDVEFFGRAERETMKRMNLFPGQTIRI